MKVLKLRILKRVGSAQRIDTSDDTVMDDMVKMMMFKTMLIFRGRAKSQAEIYKIDLDHANKVLSMQEEELERSKLQEVVDIVTTAKIITEVVTTVSTTITAADVPIPAATTVAAPTLTAAPSRRTKGVGWGFVLGSSGEGDWKSWVRWWSGEKWERWCCKWWQEKRLRGE
nr:hypothetical protein [Tanacetum cinerariifolium]